MILLRTRAKALWIWENKFLLQDSINESHRCLKSLDPKFDQEVLLMSQRMPDSDKVLSKPIMATRAWPTNL